MAEGALVPVPDAVDVALAVLLDELLWVALADVPPEIGAARSTTGVVNRRTLRTVAASAVVAGNDGRTVTAWAVAPLLSDTACRYAVRLASRTATAPGMARPNRCSAFLMFWSLMWQV